MCITKKANVPNNNIDRAVKRGTGELKGEAEISELTYEGYGPGGAAILIQVTSDNLNRSVAQIRHLFTKNSGNLGTPNSVAWMFDKRGLLYLDAERFPEDDVLEAALEAGADDMTTEGDQHVITTDPTLLHSVREALEVKGLSVTEAEIGMIPQNNVMVEGKDADSLLKLTDALEDHDDVSKVFSNFDIDPETLAAVDG